MDKIEELMTHISPSAQKMVHRSLRLTLFKMIVAHRNDRVELEQIEKELCSENFGSW